MTPVRRPDLRRAVPVVLVVGFLLLTPRAVCAETTYARAWYIMGTALEITLEARDEIAATVAFEGAWRAVARVDSLMSLYRPESELVRLNREAARHPVSVDAATFEVLASALHWSGVSGGAFDVSVKPLMDAWGFYRSAPGATPPPDPDSLAARIGWRWIELDPVRRTVRFHRQGMAVDLGGIAKGYAVDRACDALRAAGVTRALVNLSGNMRALGAPSAAPEGWPVGVRDPLNADSLLAEFPLCNMAISSSGDYERSVIVDGVRVSHIMDPLRGRPVVGVAGTTVTAATALSADILSTTLFVRGGIDRTLLDACPEGAFLVVRADGARLTASGRKNRLHWIAGIQNRHYIEDVGLVRRAGNPEPDRSGWGKGTASSTSDGRQTDLP